METKLDWILVDWVDEVNKTATPAAGVDNEGIDQSVKDDCIEWWAR